MDTLQTLNITNLLQLRQAIAPPLLVKPTESQPVIETPQPAEEVTGISKFFS